MMKAALLPKEGKALEVRSVADPAAGGWAIVSMKAAGVCGTELHYLDRMLVPPHHPFVLGHEMAGVVLEAPEDSNIRPGDRVAVYNFIGCKVCHWCRTGREEICAAPKGQLGFTVDGGFSDKVRSPAENLIKLPDNVSFETAAVLSCSGMTAVHAIRLADVRVDSVSIVNGVGGVGLMVVQAIVAAGGRAIAVADSESKAQLAKSVGAQHSLVVANAAEYDALPDRVKALTSGEGADHYFELVGTKATMLAGIRALGRNGTCLIIGYTGEDLTVNPVELLLYEKRILSSVAAARQDLETAISLSAQGKLRVTVDTRYPLADIGTALTRLRNREVSGRNIIVW